MQQFIQLEPGDDIQGIRARIDAAELSHVVLVLPRVCAALGSDYSWQLLKRAAQDAGVQVAVVTRNAEVLALAARYGIPGFLTTGEARTSPWRVAPAEAPGLVTTRDRLRDSLVSLRLPVRLTVSQMWIVIGIVVLLSCVLCFVLALLVPAATVRITPAPLAVTLSTDILADLSVSQINATTRSVPVRWVEHEVNGTAQIRTTTEKSIPNAPSTGTVIFSNLRTEKTTVPQGTIVKTSGGVPVRFTTVTSATLPAGLNSRVEVAIQAVEPGPTGNVKELTINTIEGSLALEARVINLKPTASGSLKPVKVVTAEDKKKLEAQLREQLRRQGIGVLEKELKEIEILPPDSVVLEVGTLVFDRAVDDPAEVLNLSIAGRVGGMALDAESSQALFRPLLQKQVPANHQLLPTSVQLEILPGGKYQNRGNTVFRVPIRAMAYATPQIDKARIAGALQGKSAVQAREYLSNTIRLAKPAEISITPMLWNRMPWFGFRIAVSVEQQSVSQK